MNASLDVAELDLVVFLGDMIHSRDLRGEAKVRKAIDAAASPVVEREIPFALVFGNHDEECGISKEEQLKIYQSYPGCLAVDGEDLPRCGNYYLVVENPVKLESPVVL
ncbi:metallophosphoesterase [Aristaeella hokkaidonensis]|uniref:Metallophosphoesterase n=2 Tax=Aristaeella hokkaidonensis TaxID=3046382 RepID=A0AC61MV55_9FIRM|nr:metallophosphoesterase [Aristaeella hokkaidonensis]QUC66355.1 metallophosphoesterase [Aristaeella hokkaidonensis]